MGSRSTSAGWVRLVALAAGLLAVVAGACSGSGDDARPSTPTATPASPLDEALAPTVAPSEAPTATPVPTPFAPGDGDALPVDPDVRVGTLDNGLTFHLRHNESPGGRAELRLVVDAGSALEDPDQSGVAHFLEHMLFNGTERYPANELISVLESFGSEFGPDVNAYTSYDETVYELSIPTDDEALVREAFGVLQEWAANATIDPAEVEAERGVVVEEWRLRDQGVGGRLNRLYEELLTAGTLYEGRSPIGDVEDLRTMSADVLRRFYDDWYRPDLMAVVVVGDLDLDLAEGLVREGFGDLEMPDDPRPRPEPRVAPAASRAYRQLADPEMPFAYVEMIHPGPAESTLTVGDYRRSLAYDVATELVRSRFADDVARGTAPFTSAYVSTTPLARGLATPGLLAEAMSAQLDESLEALLIEVERVRRDGFTAQELDRGVSRMRSEVEQAYAGRDTTQDAEYADASVARFLADTPMLSWEDFRALEGRLLSEMTPEYVAGVFIETLGAAAPQVVVVAPEADAALLPDEAAVSGLLDRVPAGDVALRADASRDLDTLMGRPRPAAVVATDTDRQLDSRSVSFANGVTVHLKSTTIADNALVLQATSPGGLSVLDADQLAAASLAGEVVTSSGVGDLDEVELGRALADDVVSVSFAPGETEETIAASAATEDAETMLQLLHQYLVAPRATDAALATTVARIEPVVSQPGRIPQLAAEQELREARFGPGRRFRLLPTAADLAALRPEDVVDVFSELYGDSGDLTVAVVGDFDPDTMTDLVARYLGTLPGDGAEDRWVDHQRDPPRGLVERTVRAGRDPQGNVSVLVTAPVAAAVPVTQAGEIQLEVLEHIVSVRLRNRLRETLGATYSPSATITSVERPDAAVETRIEVSGDPGRLDEIVDEIRLVLAALRAGGPTAIEVATATEQVRRDLELVSNGYWVDRLLYADAHPGITMLTIAERIEVAEQTTEGAVAALAAQVLTDDHVIVVRLVPGG